MVNSKLYHNLFVFQYVGFFVLSIIRTKVWFGLVCRCCTITFAHEGISPRVQSHMHRFILVDHMKAPLP